jgi:hypothetical protein
MAAYIEVATTQARSFVEALLILGAAGATIPKDCVALKGPMLRAKVFLEEDKGVKMTPCMRKIHAESRKKEEKASPVEAVKLSREAMEEMSLGELRKATGITQGGKEAIIKQYLGEPADAE